MVLGVPGSLFAADTLMLLFNATHCSGAASPVRAEAAVSSTLQVQTGRFRPRRPSPLLSRHKQKDNHCMCGDELWKDVQGLGIRGKGAG